MDIMTPAPLIKATNPKIVQTQPFPMASIKGAPTRPPTQEKMFRTKLFTAIPVLAFLGINSVNMVVAIAKTIMAPTPKKKFAINCGS
jgi:hypothetical protein